MANMHSVLVAAPEVQQCVLLLHSMVKVNGA